MIQVSFILYCLSVVMALTDRQMTSCLASVACVATFVIWRVLA